MATNTEAAAVRNRRKATTKTEPASPPTTPVAVGAGEPARHFEALGDPREPRVQVGTMPNVPDGHQFSRPHPLAPGREVAEATGWVQDRADRDDFVIAACDVHEIIYPKGCTTPTSRLRWAAGQHVPVEVYRAWEAEQAAAQTEQAETPQT